MQLRGIQFALMPNRWIIITANLFGRQMCGYGEITTLFEFIIIFPPQPRPFWLILTSKIYRITACSLFSFSVFFFREIDRLSKGTLRPLQNIYSTLIPQSLLMFSGSLLLLLHQSLSLNPNILVLDSILLFFFSPG